MRFILFFCACFVFLGQPIGRAQLPSNGATASFRGALPPKPVADLSDEQLKPLEERLAKLTETFAAVKKHPRSADAAILLKAVRYAIEFHEWYGKKPEDGIKAAKALLDEAARRIEALKSNQTPWMEGSGQKILGYYSKIDDSAQPYGVEIPDGLTYGADQPSIPMWIWLHGRGDTTTDLHFIYKRLTAKAPGQFQPQGTIVIHPFGRYCNGWKSAGETDVFEARDDAMARFHVDPNRVALAGFSMGGAGAWHIGAHFADQWACVHTGAGFVDVKRYQKLTPESYPVWYEQKLWGVYDVPDYAANFRNVPLVCYSGEKDTQRDSATYMMEVLDKIGLHPPHLIGPEMGHKYHPEVIKEVQSKIESEVAKGRNPLPKHIVLQTRTLAYNRMHWLQITGLENHWEDSRVEATWDESLNAIRLTTKNVSGLGIQLPKLPKVLVDGIETPSDPDSESEFVWSWRTKTATAAGPLSKRPKLQGPIDDGFKDRFIVVMPDLDVSTSAADRWAHDEAVHFLVRWRSLMRGDAIVRKASDITDQDMKECHLVLWGTPHSNSLISKTLASPILREVLTWNDRIVKVGSQSAPAETSVAVLCYPNPLSPSRYVILNSGLTFREAHDRTNSLQNPKLPDWAILDISEPPTAEAAGKVVAADFFDSRWKVIDRAKSPEGRD